MKAKKPKSNEPCPTCHGTGVCDMCGGSGELMTSARDKVCRKCNGSGNCQQCNGSGLRQ